MRMTAKPYGLRDRASVAICNWIMRHVASDQYRTGIDRAIRRGLAVKAGPPASWATEWDSPEDSSYDEVPIVKTGRKPKVYFALDYSLGVRFEVIDHTTGGEGRIMVRSGDISVEPMLQDGDQTLKVFLSDRIKGTAEVVRDYLAANLDCPVTTELPGSAGEPENGAA